MNKKRFLREGENMNRKNLKKAMNLIFIISIGIPFTVSILIHGSLIERLIE